MPILEMRERPLVFLSGDDAQRCGTRRFTKLLYEASNQVRESMRMGVDREAPKKLLQ